MKNNFIYLLTLLVLTCLSVPAFAGNSGGGGVGVRVGNRIHILDLYEIDVDQPVYDSAVKISHDIETLVENGLSNSIDAETRSYVTRKLSEIYRVNQGMAFLLAYGLGEYLWYVEDRDLTNTEDEDSTIDIPPNMRVQLAVRQGNVIRINKAFWLVVVEFKLLLTGMTAVFLLHLYSFDITELGRVRK